MGGTLAAIEVGFQQRQIQDSSYASRAMRMGKPVVVGVNRFRDEGHRTPQLQRDRPGWRNAARVESLRTRPRGTGSGRPGRRRFAGSGSAPGVDENLMPVLIEAWAPSDRRGDLGPAPRGRGASTASS